MTMNANIDPIAEAEEKALDENTVAMRKSTIIVRRFMRNKTAVVGLAIFVVLVVFSWTGQFFTKWKKDDLDFININKPPSASHILGTNQAGIDLYIQLVEGLRISIIIGLTVGLIGTLVAAIYGTTQALLGGKVDKVMLFILEAMIMLPALLVLAIVTSGTSSITQVLPGWILLIVVLIIFGWMGTARLIRALTMSTLSRDFVRAAKYMGVPKWKIVVRHLIPNLGSLLVLQVTLGVSAAILAEVGYSFVGIGIKPPNVSLGLLLSQAAGQVNTAPWMFWFPLIAMFLLTGSFAMMNDGLRDALDPNSSSVGKAKKKNKKKDAAA